MPLFENNHHVTGIDSYVNIVCEKFKKEYEQTDNGNFNIVFTEDDFSNIPNKFFTECKIIVNFMQSKERSVSGGYDYNKLVVEENPLTANDETIPANKRIFDRIFFEIQIDIEGLSLSWLLKNLSVVLAHEMTHALQHINMVKNHNNDFTDSKYLRSYGKIAHDANASNEDDDVLKGEFAGFLYMTDQKEKNAYISEFYTEVGYLESDDVSSPEKINSIIRETSLWEIVKKVYGRVEFYNLLSNEETKEKLIKCYNFYFPDKKIKTYSQFRRRINNRWDNFYCRICNRIINMVKEKVDRCEYASLHGVDNHNIR